MKFNWGIGITIAIILFMGYILLMVYKATSTEQHLQAEDYYSQEISYQTKIDALRLGDEFSKSVKFVQNANGAELILPEGFTTDNNSINLHLLRPNDSSLDLKFKLSPEDNTIGREKLLGGFYKVTISWITDGEKYATESDLTIK